MATALPGHEVPLERRGSEAQKARYVAECCDEILPALAADGARFVDVFCEHGVFGLEESRRILEAGKACGLLPRLHADELTPLGGARLAAEVGALSADHLLFAQPDGIHAMAKAGVVATLLPGTSVFLRMNRYAPGAGDDRRRSRRRPRHRLQPRLLLHRVAPRGRVLRDDRDGADGRGGAHGDDA